MRSSFHCITSALSSYDWASDLDEAAAGRRPPSVLRAVPLEVQEAMVLDDLLSVLLVRPLFSPAVRALTLA